MNIIIDSRESKVIPHFDDSHSKRFNNITFKIKQITVGDYWITYDNKILVCIERKTWKDLAQSFRDGRKNNVNKMKQLREKNNCSLVYLIEGKPLPSKKRRFARVPYIGLRSHLDHLIFRDNIHVIHSKNPADSAYRIYELTKNYSTMDVFLEMANNVKGGADKTKIKLSKENKEKSIIYKLWQAFPGVSSKSATVLIDNKIHISDIILGEIKKDDLSILTYLHGGTFGDSRASKILKIRKGVILRRKKSSKMKYQKYKKYHIKLLEAIPGITKNTAEIILDKYCISEISEGKINKKKLSEIKKTEKRRLGPKVAGDIIKYFCKLEI